MTDWKPGDRLQLINGLEFVAMPTWFDTHATKIQRLFKFGDRVWVGQATLGVAEALGQPPKLVEAIVVRDEDDLGIVVVHQRGEWKAQQSDASNLTLIEPEAD